MTEEKKPRARQQMMNNQVPSLRCPTPLLRKARALEMKVRKLQRLGDREVKAVGRRWNDKIERVREAMLDEIEEFKDAHGLPPDLMLDTSQGLFVFVYRKEDADKLMDVPVVPEIEDVSLGREDAGDLPAEDDDDREDK